MASKYSYNLARESENLKPTNSTDTTLTVNTSLAPSPFSPFSIFKDVASHMFASPKPGNKSLTVLDSPKADNSEDENMEEESLVWKEKDEGTYQRLLEEENRRLTEFIEEILPASENPEEDFKFVFQSQIEALNEEVKGLEGKCRSLEEFRRKEKEDIERRHERELSELKIKYESEIEKVVQENRELIDEIINSQLDEIQLWRMEFEKDCESKGVEIFGCDDENKEHGSVSVAELGVMQTSGGPSQTLFEKFKDLSAASQSIVVAGMGIASLVIGYYSWPFLNWAWPRLVAFATDTRVLNAAVTLASFTQSSAYEDLMDAWKNDQPLAPILFRNFGQDIVNQIIKLAPMLFRIKGTAISV